MAVELFDQPVLVLTPKSDVWAFGMTVVEVSVHSINNQNYFAHSSTQILTGQRPFSDIENYFAVIMKVTQDKTEPHPSRKSCAVITDELWSMLLRCWDKDPDRRPSMHRLALVLDLVFVGLMSVSGVEKLLNEKGVNQSRNFTLKNSRNNSDRGSSDSEPLHRHLHLCGWNSCQEEFTDLETFQWHEWEHFERQTQLEVESTRLLA